MAFSLFDSTGVGIDQQRFTWRELVQNPISKLDDDAFTRVRVILIHGLETEAVRFGHMAARFNRELRLPLAKVRRTEQHQATLANWLIAADHSPLETTVAYAQLAVEVGAAIAQREPDPALAQVYRFGLLEDLDHLYRFAALLDRLEGKDANNILQSYTDIVPGRPTSVQHRAPEDNLREPRNAGAALSSMVHALTIVASQYQARDYYMNIGPLFSDPLARQLYAEIASIKEQHISQYESMLAPATSWIEQWLLHEATECYLYYSCMADEGNHHLRALWERFLDYELGHFHMACDALRQVERRDPAAIVSSDLAGPLLLRSQREFVRKVRGAEAGLRTDGSRFVTSALENPRSLAYRSALNAGGSPSDMAACGYVWMPGTELNRTGMLVAAGAMAP
jgi:hypothetical protein